MTVTRLEEVEQSGIKVYIDGEYAFLLYQKDIAAYKLQEGTDLSDTLYEQILEETVFYRAKQKALSVLKFMDRSEQELRRKLTQAGYPDMIIDKAVFYVTSYGYLDDERYAGVYIRSRMKNKSKLMIRTELLQKGINREIIDKVFLEEYGADEEEDAELSAIRKAVAKKTNSPESLSHDEKQKLIASLYRKGFDLSKINRILS